ncbi:MAG: glycosyltransferase family 2 protein [Candidatus Aureabacteria bacterium]|nr:glycosyltransferase family 2 protein [Candidatus Auribacterota bacterium]
MKVSVVIPLYNDENNIFLVLDAFLRQTMRPYEIIVVDNGSKDRSKEVVRSFIASNKEAPVVLDDEREKGAASARNRGITLASGDIIAFLDSDCIPEKDWVESIVGFFLEHPEYDAVGGSHLSYPSKNILENFMNLYWFLDTTLFPEMELRDKKEVFECKLLSTYNSAFRTASVKKIGLFDTSFKTAAGEDVDYVLRALQANVRMYLFFKKMIVYHNFKKMDFFSILRKQKEYTRTWTILLKNYMRRSFCVCLFNRMLWNKKFPLFIYVTHYTCYVTAMLLLLIVKGGWAVIILFHVLEMMKEVITARLRLKKKKCTAGYGQAITIYVLWFVRRLWTIMLRIFYSFKCRIYYL